MRTVKVEKALVTECCVSLFGLGINMHQEPNETKLTGKETKVD